MSSPPPKPDLNVLPDSYRRRRLQGRQILFLVVLVILIALTVVLYQATSTAMDKTSELEREVEILEQRVELRKTEVARLTEMVNLITEYETISQKRGVLTEDLKAITSAAEGVGIEIASVLHESESVAVSCQTSGDFKEDREALDAYCEALKQTGRFSSAEYSLSIAPPPASVTIEVKR